VGWGLAEESVVENLLEFGFTRVEAKIYLFLLRVGPCPAGLVANKLGGNRMKAYRTLKVLQERGLVEVAVGRPVKFVALPLNETLDRLLEESRARFSNLEESKKKIMEYWAKLPKAEALVEEPKFRILQGRQRVYEMLLKMCERAKVEIRLATTENDLYRLSFAGIEDKLRGLHREGVRTLVLTQVDEQGVEAVKNYLGFAEVRHTALSTNMRFVTIDESESLTAFAMDDSMSMNTQNDEGLWTNAFSYVKTMKASFEALWSRGIPAKEILLKLMAQQKLMEGLNIAKKALEEAGWVVDVPGRIAGESGVVHSFNLVAKHADQLDRPLALDLLTHEEVLYQLVALTVKVMDVKLAGQFIVATRPLDERVLRLADQYGIRPIYADKAAELAAKIIDETNRILKR
jgi:sugar-specific transcriptional regulator TrmB